MNVLVVGGAGYIGSHMVRLLDRSGHTAVVLDNLSEGHQAAVKPGQLIVGEMSNDELVRQTLADLKIDAVMHFAANALVGESVENPAKYYNNNVVATYRLLESMRTVGVKKFVFSSTCATYGQPDRVPISEEESQEPINPYGFTKLVVERMLADYSSAYDFGYAALRYFNAAGASPDGDIGEDHDPETHLIPIILQVALGQRAEISVFGDDYDTPDGTCIRDYIHVDDLSAAHLSALDALAPGVQLKLNLGTGQGNSVLEVIDACKEITGCDIPIKTVGRRAGDPARLVAAPQLAHKTLGWQPQYTEIRKIVETAWAWHQSHPEGYAD